jgi:hypothetical protein
MSNQQKAEFVSENFGIQSFQGGHGKRSRKVLFVLKGTVCPQFLIQQPCRVPSIVTHKYLIIWIQKMDHRKVVRVAYRNDIWDFQRFGLAKTQKLSSIQPLFCPEQILAA